MAFHEVQFPTDISYGSAGGPGTDTTIIELDSGIEQRFARRSKARREYNVAYGVKSKDMMTDLIDFFIARNGAEHGFRYKDFTDFTSAVNHRDTPAFTDQVIDVGDGSTLVFQLCKTYTSGSTEMIRNIKKPVADTVLLGLGGAEQENGWSINTTTGVVTFDAAPANEVEVTAGFEFDTPVRFGKESEAPLNIAFESYDVMSAQNISVMEIIDEDETPDSYFYGGASHLNLSANYSLALNDGRAISATPTAAGKRILLPATTSLPCGGVYFHIINLSENYSIVIANSANTSIATLGVLETSIVVLGYDTDGTTKRWYVL